MQPLSLPDGVTRAMYHAALFRTHDFSIEVDVLNKNGHAITSITDSFLDGQVNIQAPGNPIRRTLTATFFDPDGTTLHMDTASPWEGALFFDREIRVRHILHMREGDVTATVFVGPVSALSRDGETVAVEAQDRAAYSASGHRPVTVRKGANAVSGVRKMLRDGSGERRFRLPQRTTKRLPRAFSCGWKEEASPWRVASRMASLTGRRLYYTADGFASMRALPSRPVLTIPEYALLEEVKVAHDVTAVANYVRVTNTTKVKKKVKQKGKTRTKTVTRRHTYVVPAPRKHPLSPQSLGRNGVGRFLPMLVDTDFRKAAQARRRARTELNRNLPMTSKVDVSCVPVFHLDADDMVAVVTPNGRINVRFVEGSIPLGVQGGMQIGQQRRVSRGRRA